MESCRGGLHTARLKSIAEDLRELLSANQVAIGADEAHDSVFLKGLVFLRGAKPKQLAKVLGYDCSHMKPEGVLVEEERIDEQLQFLNCDRVCSLESVCYGTWGQG